MFSRFAAILFGAVLVSGAHAQMSNGYVFGGVTLSDHLEGAGRFGAGFDFRLRPRLDLGAEIGTIHKHDVGVLGSGNLSYHFNRRRGEEWDPFFVGGVSAARIYGINGLYVNLGLGMNYWVDSRWALRGEFKAYPGGQDLGSFAEIRFGIAFR